MKNRMLFVFFLLLSCVYAEENHPLSGHWEGNIQLPGMQLVVLIDLTSTPEGKWEGKIDIPAQAAKGLPLENIKAEGANVSFQIQNVPGTPTFSGELAGEKITGKFTQAGQTYPFELHRKAATVAESQPKKSEQEVLADISALIKKEMEEWHVPALSIAIVKDQKILFAEGFGMRDVKSKQPATADTMYAIGSSSKAFTATSVGIQVDQGKLKWDQPVKTYLPAFALHDEFASERMTPVDLLTHRSGLPRHDFLWYNNQFNRQQLFDRLKYLEANEDFREIFQYQNLMFMTAGYLAGFVAGKSWEEVVRQQIFQPLKMNSSNFSVNDMKKVGDFALPYRYEDENPAKKKKAELKEIPFRNIDAIGPAGSINSNVREMAHWVMMNLNGGSFDGKKVISKHQLDQIHSPQITISGGIFSQLLASPEAPYLMYGMGWIVQPYRGRRLLHHGGNIDGFSSMVSFLPDDKYGLVILTNLDGNIMVNSLQFEIYDRLLGLDPVDWNSRFKLIYEQFKQAAQASETKEVELLKKTGTKPSHALADYVGTYESDGYGKLRITQEGQNLKATYGDLVSPLEHWHYNVFNATEVPVKGTKITFLSNLRGDIDRLSVPMEPSVDEIVFTMAAPESMYQRSFLQQFTGEYDLMGLTVTVQIQEESGLLTITVPGQPTYVLEPYRGTEFNLKDVPGFSVRFIVENGKTKEVIFIQPGSVISAKKK